MVVLLEDGWTLVDASSSSSLENVLNSLSIPSSSKSRGESSEAWLGDNPSTTTKGGVGGVGGMAETDSIDAETEIK
ncbi:hypothetical protein IEQ34_000886 [Dendrobium chrysotoxum]|uniref:Uncharacterized protein n=1 Tax=Dendrobium chrysotoxum TaxID=161865 RepID=A0AAV7HTH7_DENCH|nr:hypothetical protein IEQ34_000886 [Dendrobium chrysotoxum]